MEDWDISEDYPLPDTPYHPSLRTRIRCWWFIRRTDAAQRRVEKKLRKAVDNLLRIESYALRHDAIFGPVHDTLIDAINCLDAALSDYDGRIDRWPVAKIGYDAARARAGQQE
jgi:hypothetical protein